MKNTSFDYQTPKLIGEKSLDGYFVLNTLAEKAASIYSPKSGIEMKVHTNQTGLVIFTLKNFEAICF